MASAADYDRMTVGEVEGLAAAGDLGAQRALGDFTQSFLPHAAHVYDIGRSVRESLAQSEAELDALTAQIAEQRAAEKRERHRRDQRMYLVALVSCVAAVVSTACAIVSIAG